MGGFLTFLKNLLLGPKLDFQQSVVLWSRTHGLCQPCRRRGEKLWPPHQDYYWLITSNFDAVTEKRREIPAAAILKIGKIANKVRK